MKRKIYSVAAIAAVAVLGTALFFFKPVFGFTQAKSTAGTETGQVAAAPQLAALNTGILSILVDEGHPIRKASYATASS